MKVGLFIPCYVDAFFPEVGIATLEILERCGLDVVVSARPDLLRAANGEQRLSGGRGAGRSPVRQELQEFDYIVGPSGSCVHHIRAHFDAIPQTDGGHEAPRRHLRARRVPARRAEAQVRFPGPSSRTRSGCTTAARRCARCARHRHPRSTSRRSRSQWICSRKVEGIEFVHAGATGRMLRLRRHLLGVRGAGLSQDGLRQGQRPRPRRRRIHRLGRHVRA